MAVGLYGWSARDQKHETWNLMRLLHSGHNLPMFFFVDFKENLVQEEKESGALRSQQEMDAFRTVIEDCGLIDLGWSGIKLTWERGTEKNPNAIIRERLDCFLADSSWCEHFQNFHTKTLPRYCSDHSVIFLDTEVRKTQRGRPQFRFESMWLKYDE